MSNPIRPSFKTEWFPVALIILSFAIGLYFYNNFPAQVASHWNWRGEVDGYSSAGVAAFLLPTMALAMYLIFLFLPYLDPKKEEYVNFSGAYHKFKNLLVIFLCILFIMTGLNGLGHTIDIGSWVPILIGALFVIIGMLLKDIKMNWFMGIRTPWTMSSEAVWNKTHEMSGPVMMIAGVLIAATVLTASFQGKIILFVVSLALIVIGLPLYSYILYRQEKKTKK